MIIVTLAPGNTPASFGYSTLFLMIFLFWIYAIYSKYQWRKYILLLIFGIVAWIFHPLQNVLVFIILSGVTILYSVAPQEIFDRLGMGNVIKDIRVNTIFVFIFGISGFLWMSYVTLVFSRGLNLFSGILVTEASGSTASISKGQISILLNEFGYSWFDILTKIFIYKFGLFVILLLMGGFGVLVNFIKKDSNRRLPIFLTIGFVLPATFSFIEAVFSISGSIQFARFARPALAFSIISIPYLLFSVLSYKRGTVTKIIYVLSVSLIIFGVIMNLAGGYGSPVNHDVNRQVTESDLNGYSWYFENKNKSTDTLTLWLDVNRYADLLLTDQEKLNRQDELPSSPTRSYRVPENFGYPSKMGNRVNDSYIISSRVGRSLLTETYSSWGKFTDEDFQRLEADNTVLRIYDNGNVRVRYVNG
jgi:hypothetical protein